MELSLHILAILGCAAALWRSLRSAVQMLRRVSEAYFAAAVARTRADRGDVSGMQEAAADAARARRGRRRSALACAGWGAMLVLPAWLLESPAPVYAAYAALWLLPGAAGGRQSGPAQHRS